MNRDISRERRYERLLSLTGRREKRGYMTREEAEKLLNAAYRKCMQGLIDECLVGEPREAADHIHAAMGEAYRIGYERTRELANGKEAI